MYEKFQLESKQKLIVLAITPNKKFSQVVKIFSKIDEDKSLTRVDKIYYLAMLHSRWVYGDRKKGVERNELLSC